MQKLKSRLIGQIQLYPPGYLLIAGGAIFVLLNPLLSYDSIVRTKFSITPVHKSSEDQKNLMWEVATYFSAFVLLMVSFYFGKIYFQFIVPLRKDIRQNTKTLFYYYPQKSTMPFFNRYNISTPLYDNQ